MLFMCNMCLYVGSHICKFYVCFFSPHSQIDGKISNSCQNVVYIDHTSSAMTLISYNFAICLQYCESICGSMVQLTSNSALWHVSAEQTFFPNLYEDGKKESCV